MQAARQAKSQASSLFRAGMLARQTALSSTPTACNSVVQAKQNIYRYFTSLLASTTRSTSHHAASPTLAHPTTLQHTAQHMRTMGVTDHQRTFVRTFFRQRQGYVSFDPPATSMADQRGIKMVAYLSISAVGVVTVVWVSNRQEVPFTHRIHTVLVSAQTEQAMGTQVFQQIKQQAAAQGRLLPPNHKAVQAVEAVGKRLEDVVGNGVGGGYQSQLKDVKWEYAVIDSDEVNAFVVPGGKVCVYTGLLKILKNRDELAAVLAHETAHVVARHAGERLSQQLLLQLVRTTLFMVLGFEVPSSIIYLLFFLPYGRLQETEADIIGMHLAAQACYDPGAGQQVFARMDGLERKSGTAMIPKFLRTHPVNEDRIQRIQQELPKAMQEYERANCGLIDRFAVTWGWAPDQTVGPRVSNAWQGGGEQARQGRRGGGWGDEGFVSAQGDAGERGRQQSAGGW